MSILFLTIICQGQNSTQMFSGAANEIFSDV